MFLGQHSRRKGLPGVVTQHRHCSLDDDRTVIEIGRDEILERDARRPPRQRIAAEVLGAQPRSGDQSPRRLRLLLIVERANRWLVHEGEEARRGTRAADV